MNNLEARFRCNYSMFSMQGFFRIFNEDRFLYRLGLSITGTSKTVPYKPLYIVV